jgi:DNA-directed RNA polymerase subunit RPC12/RpoP
MAYVFLALCFGLAGGIVGRIKGSSFWLWFLISGVVPVLGLLAAIAYRVESNEPRRRCPRCGHVTKAYDALCMKCGTELEYPDVLIAPESYEPPVARS